VDSQISFVLIWAYAHVTDAFIRSIKAITDRRAGLRASLERVGGQEATRFSTLVQSVRVLDGQFRRPSEPAFRFLEPVQGSMKHKVVLNPPGSARYGRPLRQSAGLVDRAVARA
jgi:hypothetical protein